MLAERGRPPVAGALNLDRRRLPLRPLLGRRRATIPFLHFELCYYQAIEYAIQHRLARVEAGAQGEHKLARGYLPTQTYSAHYIADPSLRRAIADYLVRERAHVDAASEELAEYAPFRKAIQIRSDARSRARRGCRAPATAA